MVLINVRIPSGFDSHKEFIVSDNRIHRNIVLNYCYQIHFYATGGLQLDLIIAKTGATFKDISHERAINFIFLQSHMFSFENLNSKIDKMIGKDQGKNVLNILLEERM